MLVRYNRHGVEPPQRTRVHTQVCVAKQGVLWFISWLITPARKCDSDSMDALHLQQNNIPT